jgi:hypothetical protein
MQRSKALIITVFLFQKNQALQSTPLCQEMQLNHDYDDTLVKRSLHHSSAVTGQIGVILLYTGIFCTTYIVPLFKSAPTPGDKVLANQVNDANESMEIVFMPRHYRLSLVRYCSRLRAHILCLNVLMLLLAWGIFAIGLLQSGRI